ncbi:MAG: DUF4149 domain-containing protein [Helicobacteraceae bacterium]|jgi:hypothetical protein|nr:DUF4149 domain-containing protein [Helicobacteraceae bacterium]
MKFLQDFCVRFGSLRSLSEAFYLTFLGIVLGSTLVLGAIVAPVVFKAALFMDLPAADLLASGRLMSEIFRRFSYILAFASLLIAAYEIWSFFADGREQTAQTGLEIAIKSAAAIAVISSAAFAFYYTPEVLRMQELGAEAIDSARFSAIHRQAESVFKILSASLFALLFARLVAIKF